MLINLQGNGLADMLSLLVLARLFLLREKVTASSGAAESHQVKTSNLSHKVVYLIRSKTVNKNFGQVHLTKLAFLATGICL